MLINMQFSSPTNFDFDAINKIIYDVYSIMLLNIY